MQAFQSNYALPCGEKKISLETYPGVLPPDRATLDMAVNVGRLAYAGCFVSARFSKLTTPNQAHREQEPIRILDIGSGTGVLSIVAALEAHELGTDIGEVVALDNDPVAVENTEANYAHHLGEAGIKFAVHSASWDEAEFWDEAGVFDVIVCNPPYLVSEDNPKIRPGLDSVNDEALYVETKDELDNLYSYLIGRSLDASTIWSQIHLRLPREGDELVRRLVPEKVFRSSPA